MKKLPPLNAIRAFEAAGRHVSFTKAAVELNVTHGAISRQVATLERWMGTSLFVRGASQLVLTPTGRSYLAEVSASLDRLALASIHAREQAAPVVLQVNSPPTFTMRWLIARMSGFQRMRPEVEIRLTTSLAPVNFAENRYDVAIRGAAEPLTHCISEAFMTELIVPVCHVDLVQRRRLRRPADLARETLLSYSTEPYAWSDWLAAAGLSSLVPVGTLRFEQMYFALQAASEGLGVVLVPLFLAIDDILAGRVCTPFGLLHAKRRRYFANSAVRNPVIEDFRRWLLHEGAETERSIDSWATREAA
jgi:LysR family transcriptional regulator, glycine cleavage system transcriptional activator